MATPAPRLKIAQGVPPATARPQQVSRTFGGRLVSKSDITATERLLEAMRVELPSGQQQYETLLKQLLWTLGPGAPQAALDEVSEPSWLELAQEEYGMIWSAFAASLFYSGDLQLDDSALKRLWRPATKRQLPIVQRFADEVRAWQRSLPPGTLDHLREYAAGRHGRRRLRGGLQRGAVLEADRLRWYYDDIDEQQLARRLQKLAPPHGSRREPPSGKWLSATVRRTRSRIVPPPPRPVESPRAGQVSMREWRRSTLARWLRPLRPDFIAQKAQSVSNVTAKLGQPPSMSSAESLPVTSLGEAMERYLPDDVWARVEGRVLRAAREMRDPRRALLAVAVYGASPDGWSNLPYFLGISASTARRLRGRLQRAGSWTPVKRALLAGAHGRDLDPEKLGA